MSWAFLFVCVRLRPGVPPRCSGGGRDSIAVMGGRVNKTPRVFGLGKEVITWHVVDASTRAARAVASNQGG